MASALAQQGTECVVYTRANAAELPKKSLSSPGTGLSTFAGPHHLPKEALTDIIDEFTEAVVDDIEARGGVDAVHAHYWLSGDRARSQTPPRRAVHCYLSHPRPSERCRWRSRARLPRSCGGAQIGCADAVCVSCDAERSELIDHYGVPAGRVVIVSPGVEHAIFGPGDRRGARQAIGEHDNVPLVLFAGRIQALKGPDVAIRACSNERTTCSFISCWRCEWIKRACARRRNALARRRTRFV